MEYQGIVPVLKEPTDGLTRTKWQDPTSMPHYPGSYETATGGGHVFRRRWDGRTWRLSHSDAPTNVQMPWRGIVPNSPGAVSP